MFRKSISLLLSIVMIISAMIVIPLQTSAKEVDVAETGSYADDSGRWQIIKGVQQECCTYRVWHEAYNRLGISLPITWGNAASWAYNASRDGYSVDSTPAVNSIVCWSGGTEGYGHVAYVTGVDANKIYIREAGINPSYSYPDYWFRYDSFSVSNQNRWGGYQLEGYIHLRCATHTWNNGVVTKKADCKHNGVKTYTCTVCGETKTETIKGGHRYSVKVALKANLIHNGKLLHTCKVCGKKATSVIYRPKTIKLKQLVYTYDGQFKKPAVIITDTAGKTIAATYYVVAYAKHKNVGLASATVKFKGRYSGSKKLSFQIIPKGTSVSKLSAGKNWITVNWTKQKVQTKGYQIQYATDSKFTKNRKTLTISNTNTVSKKITGLKTNTNYYVRVRTYQKVSGLCYFSSWSKAKNVRTTSASVNWKNLYKSFILNKTYLKMATKSVDSKLYNSTYNTRFENCVLFRLRDLNRDGIPELIVYSGIQSGHYYFLYHFYTVKNGKVVYIDSLSLSGETPFISKVSGYNGFFTYSGDEGYWTARYISMSGSKINNQVVIYSSPDGSVDVKNAKLYQVMKKGIEYKPYLTFKYIIQGFNYSNIKSMGWNAFLKKFGY